VVDDLATLLIAVAAGSAGFLVHNWPPARIFMGDQGEPAQAFDDHAGCRVERPQIIGQSEGADDGRSANDRQRLHSPGLRRDRERAHGAARDRHPPEVRSGAVVTPIHAGRVEQAVPDRDPPHGLGQQRDKDEGQGARSQTGSGQDHDVTRSGGTASSAAASAIISSRISPSEWCGDHPVRERSFVVSGTRRCMSSNPELDVRDSRGDCTRLRQLFPDVTPIALDEGLQRTVDWFRRSAEQATGFIPIQSGDPTAADTAGSIG
jgi:hypothetical protein